MPKLDWIGKQAVVNHHKEVPYRLLECDDALSVGDPGCGNLLVEGDNLEALKALLPHYAGQVKCVYIDPPYNTGNKDWIYNDRVDAPENRKWFGDWVGPEADDLCRHDKWLCMMYPRMVLLRELLRDDGVIFVSIDENEACHLGTLMDEIYHRANLVGIMCWVRKKKGAHLDMTLRKMTEFVFVYAKSIAALRRSGGLFGEAAYPDKWQPLVKRTNSLKSLLFPAGAIETPLSGGGYSPGVTNETGTALRFEGHFRVRDGRIMEPIEVEGRFVWTQAKLDQELAAGTRIALSTRFGFNVLRWDQEDKSKRPTTMLNGEAGVGTNEDASAELAQVMDAEQGTAFDFPKPVSLIQYLVRSATKEHPDALILDSFAGSGTTGHAVLAQNAEDGGNRKFILVELEPHIAQPVTRERLKRVIEGYGHTKQGGQEAQVDGLAGGFRYCRLGATMFDEKGRVNPQVTWPDLARHLYFAETREPVGQTILSATPPLIGVFNGTAYYLLYNGAMRDKRPSGGNVLTAAVLASLPPHDGPKVVYGTSCRLGEDRVKREGVQFRHIPYEIRVG